MEFFARVISQGTIVEHNWTNDRGESRVIASIEVILSTGLDTMVVEANDDLARSINNGKLPAEGLFRCRVKATVRESKEKKLKFNSLRLVEIEQL